jgi:DNA-binding NtrC family response regulator
MDHTKKSLRGLLSVSTVEGLVQALMGEGQLLRVEDEIHLEVALQALHEGYSLAEIVQETVNQLEKLIISQVLSTTQGNKAEAARVLRIDYKTLYRKMQKYFGSFSEVDAPPFAEDLS